MECLPTVLFFSALVRCHFYHHWSSASSPSEWMLFCLHYLLYILSFCVRTKGIIAHVETCYFWDYHCNLLTGSDRPSAVTSRILLGSSTRMGLAPSFCLSTVTLGTLISLVWLMSVRSIYTVYHRSSDRRCHHAFFKNVHCFWWDLLRRFRQPT